MSDIFISYNHEDQVRAQLFAQALEGRGWSIFWDRTIPAGKTWRDTIGRELSEARCVIVLWSTTSIDSDWVREEADDARTRGVLVPARIDDVQPPIGFRGIQTADLSNWDATAFNRLVADIAALIASPPTTKRLGKSPLPAQAIPPLWQQNSPQYGSPFSRQATPPPLSRQATPPPRSEFSRLATRPETAATTSRSWFVYLLAVCASSVPIIASYFIICYGGSFFDQFYSKLFSAVLKSTIIWIVILYMLWGIYRARDTSVFSTKIDNLVDLLLVFTFIAADSIASAGATMIIFGLELNISNGYPIFTGWALNYDNVWTIGINTYVWLSLPSVVLVLFAFTLYYKTI
jgi:hypothetical protein